VTRAGSGEWPAHDVLRRTLPVGIFGSKTLFQCGLDDGVGLPRSRTEGMLGLVETAAIGDQLLVRQPVIEVVVPAQLCLLLR
jgi:hypothetical protein